MVVIAVYMNSVVVFLKTKDGVQEGCDVTHVTVTMRVTLKVGQTHRDG